MAELFPLIYFGMRATAVFTFSGHFVVSHIIIYFALRHVLLHIYDMIYKNKALRIDIGWPIPMHTCIYSSLHIIDFIMETLLFLIEYRTWKYQQIEMCVCVHACEHAS